MAKGRIKIAGAGISGLTAAINLAKEGYWVTVFEKGKMVGTRFNNDFQGLENWSTSEDILSILEKLNIKIDFFYKAFKEADLVNDLMEKYTIKSVGNRVGVYMIKRGTEDDSLDRRLEKQALNVGVNIKYSKRVHEKEVDVVAIGPKFASGVVYGLKGDVEGEDKIMIMLDDDCAMKGYVYLAIIEGKITVASVVMHDLCNSKKYFENALGKIERIYDLKIRNAKQFGGIGNFFLLCSYKDGQRLFTGESAGFQDYLFGFGMRYAFLSGYFAAQSIINNKDYNFVVKKNLLPIMKSSLINRYFYERLGNRGYRKLINRWVTAKDPIKFLQKWYKFNWYKQIIYPFLK